jgi:hypothetical protein
MDGVEDEPTGMADTSATALASATATVAVGTNGRRGTHTSTPIAWRY